METPPPGSQHDMAHHLADVDLIAAIENSHYQIYFSKEMDTLAQKWPRLCLYDFHLVALLPQVPNNLVPPTGVVEPACLAPRLELSGLPQDVMRAILEVRAPSTRRLYAKKLSVFASWCLAWKKYPAKCETLSVLMFLQ